MDFFRDGTMFIGGTIYVMQQNRLREWSGLKPMSLHEIPIDNPVRPPATPPAKTYILPKTSPCSLNLQVELMSLTSLASITTSALLDSGATGMFINWDFVQS